MAIAAKKQFWTEFISIYRSLPSLWNVKDENYNNRESRLIAWNKLVEKMKEVEPEANQDTVKRKINTFRSNFNRELRKIRQAKKGQQTEVYIPTLWYFDHVSFLFNQEKYNNNSVSADSYCNEESRLLGLTDSKSELSVEPDSMQSVSTSPANINNIYDTSRCEKLSKNKPSLRLRCRNSIRDRKTEVDPNYVIEQISVNDTFQNELTPLLTKSASKDCNINRLKNIDDFSEPENISTTRTVHSSLKRSKFRLKSQKPYLRHQLRNNCLATMSADEATIYGQAWACSFRKLSPQQKLFAKKAIDEILILGQLKALKLNTVNMNLENNDQV